MTRWRQSEQDSLGAHSLLPVGPAPLLLRGRVLIPSLVTTPEASRHSSAVHQMLYCSLLIRSFLSAHAWVTSPRRTPHALRGSHTPRQRLFPQRGCLYSASPSVPSESAGVSCPSHRQGPGHWGPPHPTARNPVGSSSSSFTAGHSQHLTLAVCPSCGETPHFPGLRNIAFLVFVLQQLALLGVPGAPPLSS